MAPHATGRTPLRVYCNVRPVIVKLLSARDQRLRYQFFSSSVATQALAYTRRLIDVKKKCGAGCITKLWPLSVKNNESIVFHFAVSSPYSIRQTASTTCFLTCKYSALGRLSFS